MIQSTTRRHRLRTAAAVLAAASLAVAACGSDDGNDGESSPGTEQSDTSQPDGSSAPSDTDADSDGGSSAPQGGTLRMAIPANPSSLDPQVGPSGTDLVVLYPMFDTLISFDPAKLTPTPGLAESWSYDDPTTLRLTLREGVTFHDGTPVDPDAVVASLERFQEIGAHADLTNVTTIEADGDSDVVLTLEQPDSSLLLVLADRAGMIVAPSAADDPDGFATAPIGAGPFQFVEYRTGDRVVMERYPEYWNAEEISLDGIEMRVIPDRRATANALLSGEVDFADGLDPTDLDQLSSSSEVDVATSIGMWFDMLYFNLGQPPLDDPLVRQAINHAINRDELIEGAANGLGEAAWMPVPEAHWAFDPASAEGWPYDPDEARRLLEEAGYGDGASFTVVTQSAATDVRRNEILQSQLAEVGLDMQIEAMDLNQGVSQYFEAQAFESAQYAWSGRPDPGQTYSRLFSKESYQNPAKVELPGVEDLLQQAVATDDLAERAAIYAEINQIVIEEAPYAPLYFRENVTAYRTNVSGFEPNLLGKAKVATLSIES